MRPRVKVVVVDDSPTMRALITAALQTDPDILVAAQAGNAREARQAIKTFDPDVVTLDVEMPEMSGIELLEKIMRLRPTPVVMISTLTSAGAQTTLRALELGAVDCVAKPAASGAGGEAFGDLAARVRAAASARVRPLIERHATSPRHDYVPDDRIVAIGSSTGGVEALITLLSGFPANCPPTVITQHMPPSFTRSFAGRLDRMCAPSVSEAEHGALLRPGCVYIAPGGTNHLRVIGHRGGEHGNELRCSLLTGATVNGHRPSVDVLFNSLAQLCPARVVGVLLTGMGRDGADGLLALRKGGAHTIGQDEQSCVVYGMPKVAREIGAVERILPLERIAAMVLDPALRGRSGRNVTLQV